MNPIGTPSLENTATGAPRPGGPALLAGRTISRIGYGAMQLERLHNDRAAAVAILRLAVELGIVARDDEDMLALCAAEGIAWVPFFPLGSAFPGLPKVTDEPAVVAAARSLGGTPSQIGLAWLLHHAPNILLIPGTANAEHLRANVATGAIALDDQALAALDAIPTRSQDIALG